MKINLTKIKVILNDMADIENLNYFIPLVINASKYV